MAWDAHYILDDKHNPVKVDLMTWARWLEQSALRRVDQTVRGKVRVSTVFLGLDHNWGFGPPLLFETMIFGGPEDGWQDRCSTWAQAVKMHRRGCALAFGYLREVG